MKANELRLGNLVWNEVQQIPVEVNMKIFVEQYTFDNFGTVKSWQPIPLTGEWLEKFDFEKKRSLKETTHLIEIYDYSKDGLVIEVVNQVFQTTMVYNRNNVSTNQLVPYCATAKNLRNISIPYVHQLQNLYFALTGEELILK